jgi:hypothetical protein
VLKVLYPVHEWKAYVLPPGSKSQAFLFGKLQTLLPDSPISSNAVIPVENIIIEEGDRLRIYEFDVSFNTPDSNSLLTENDILSTLVACL